MYNDVLRYLFVTTFWMWFCVTLYINVLGVGRARFNAYFTETC